MYEFPEMISNAQARVWQPVTSFEGFAQSSNKRNWKCLMRL